MNEYTKQYIKQANDFLKKANATIKIDFVGLAVNNDWEEQKNQKRNLYEITLTSPRGVMIFDFWDSIYNTDITRKTLAEYAEKRYKMQFNFLTYAQKLAAKKELEAKKAEATPNAYDILACLTKYDPGTFKNFCCEFGYNEDSRTAEKIYFAVQEEYTQLTRLFTAEQMEELQEIN